MMRREVRQQEVMATSSCNVASVQNSLIAGYVAGLTGTLVSYPMDSAKVWVQTRQAARPSTSGFAVAAGAATSPHPAGTRAASTLAMPPPPGVKLNNMIQLTRALYRGISAPLVTVGLVQSLNFAIYDSTRRVLFAASHPNGDQRNYLQDDSLLHVGAASVTAGAFLAFVTSPLVMIKTKQQVQQISFGQAARQTLRAGVWRCGFGPHFVSETAGRGIYFCAYEVCKRQWMAVSPDNDGGRHQGPSLAGRMVSAGVAGIVCWTIMFPLDVVRSRLFASSEYVTAWNMTKRIYGEYGAKGFFRGYGISVFRAGPVAAMVLPIYDYTLEHLNKTSW